MARSEPLPTSVEQMAADYVEQICKVYPNGPYCLVGWSFGGVVAHAMATHLQQRGHDIGLLAMLDAYPASEFQHEDIPEMEDQVHLEALLHFMLAESAPDVDVRPLTFDKVMEVLRSRGNALLMLDEHYFPAVFKVYKNNLHAWIDFAPDRFQGDLLLLTAADQAEGSATPDAWLPYVDGTIETHAIDSSHRNMTQLGPLAQIGAILAAKLSQISEG